MAHGMPEIRGLVERVAALLPMPDLAASFQPGYEPAPALSALLTSRPSRATMQLRRRPWQKSAT